jgi:hypothetical protein
MMVGWIDFLNWNGCTKNSRFSKLEAAKEMAKFGTTHKKIMDQLISNWSVHINGNGNEIYNGLKENI